MHNKNILQKVYGWTGFVVVWSMVGFFVFSLFAQDRAIAILVNIFS